MGVKATCPKVHVFRVHFLLEFINSVCIFLETGRLSATDQYNQELTLGDANANGECTNLDLRIVLGACGRMKKLGIELGLAKLAGFATAGYAIGRHIRFASAHIMVQTYDARWIEQYTERGYMLCDPIVSWGFGNVGAARWSSLTHPDPHNILQQARQYGLNYGVAVACGPTTSRSIGGLARGDREFTDPEIAQITEIFNILHRESLPPSSLTMAQVMALRLLAKGCRHAEAAALLGISESALKARLRSARDRLLSRTTTEAIQRAREYNLL